MVPRYDDRYALKSKDIVAGKHFMQNEIVECRNLQMCSEL